MSDGRFESAVAHFLPLIPDQVSLLIDLCVFGLPPWAPSPSPRFDVLCSLCELCSLPIVTALSSLWAFWTIPKHQMHPPTRAVERSVRRQSMMSLPARKYAPGVNARRGPHPCHGFARRRYPLCPLTGLSRAPGQPSSVRSRPDQRAKKLDGLAGGKHRIRFGQDLHGNPSSVSCAIPTQGCSSCRLPSERTKLRRVVRGF
jgi:hypothetical protein